MKRLAFLVATLALLFAGQPSLAGVATRTPKPLTAHTVRTAHTVSYDRYSLMVDGRRILLDSAEFHYWRLPSPSLWLDVLEKIKADGFNAVSVYFDWAYHSPKPGSYDFSGVRNVDELLRMTERVGLYVIARPGPYINAETTGGGFPGWLKNVPGRARSSAPGYLAAAEDWLHHVDKVIAPHQITRGGSVILYQVENEYEVNTDAAYMQDLENTARADGIDVPLTANNAGGFSNWVSGAGAVQLPGSDPYPQSFDCPGYATTWGPWGNGITPRLSPDSPVFAAEYQAGSVDENNAGYADCEKLTGPDYMSFFYKSNLIVGGATMLNYYMGYGGTSWGWLPSPNDVYTSYDYGAAITENRQLTDKYDEFKLQNYFLRAVKPLTKTDVATPPASSNSALQTAARVNPDTGTQFVLVRHAVPTATTDDTATLTWATPDGTYQVPVEVDGRAAKVLLAGYDMGGQRLVYSTSELMTNTSIGGRDVALLYGRAGEAGQTVLRYRSRPTVSVLSGSVNSSYSANGDLKLDYTHTALTEVAISGGGRRPLLLLIATDGIAAQYWQPQPDILVRGPELVRSASLNGPVLELTGDTTKATDIEVYAPSAVRVVTWNNVPVPVTQGADGALLASLPGPQAVTLPALTGWRTHAEAPEAGPGFDDSGWTTADHTTTAATPYPPQTPTVLYADDYGYHYGNVWYRGHFTATGSETAVHLNAITGKRGMYMVWLDGQYLGTAAGGTEADAGPPINPNPGPGTFAIPAGLLRPGQQAVLSILVEDMGHNDDWTAEEVRFRQPRGLYNVSFTGASPAITWKIQGARGGENLTDPVRGPLNVGGLFGERNGWYLPGYPDASWAKGTPGTVSPGVTWYRTQFHLDLPKGQDVPVALRFGGAVGTGYRVLIFLNGWNLGQYGGDIGPQTDFALPAGLLRDHGTNTLALAVIAQQMATVAPVSLAAEGNALGGVPVTDVYSPSYRDLYSPS